MIEGRTETRSAILAAARTLFLERGYAGASVRSVASAAGVDAALPIHYFGSKEALFLEALPQMPDYQPLLGGDPAPQPAEPALDRDPGASDLRDRAAASEGERDVEDARRRRRGGCRCAGKAARR